MREEKCWPSSFGNDTIAGAMRAVPQTRVMNRPLSQTPADAIIPVQQSSGDDNPALSERLPSRLGRKRHARREHHLPVACRRKRKPFDVHRVGSLRAVPAQDVESGRVRRTAVSVKAPVPVEKYRVTIGVDEVRRAEGANRCGKLGNERQTLVERRNAAAGPQSAQLFQQGAERELRVRIADRSIAGQGQK